MSHLLVACCVLAAVTAWAAVAAQGQVTGDDGLMRVELPAGREVRVENRLGGVSVELWGEPHVGIAADVEGAADAGGKSPVRLDRAANSLSVVVADAPRAKVKRRVDLRIFVPSDARLSVFTAGGSVELAGVPARLDAQTVSGDLRVRLANDADVMARTLSGTITVGAGLVAPGTAERTVRERFNARLGAGSRLVRLSTARGRIELAPLAEGWQSAARTPAPISNASSGTDPGARRETGESRRRQTPPAPSSPPPATESATDARRPALQQSTPQQSAPQQGATPLARRPPSIVGSQGARQPARPAATPAPTPAEGPIEVDPDEIITVDTHVVTLNLSVVDRRSGRGLANLTRDDFSVAENGVEQQIMHFEAANAPFDLLLLLDLSGSTAKVTEVIRASALRFVESVRAGDRVGVMTFAAAPQIVSELTDDRQRLRSRIAAMGAPTGDTKLYDAVAFAVEHMEKNSPKGRRRAVILMSDGLDSILPNVQGEGSALSYQETRSRVQEFDGLFYTVWTDTSYEALSPLDVQPETFDLVFDRMEELANVGGGLFYEVERLEDLAGAYERVVRDLGTVYSLSYLPHDKTRDGRWRAVRVRLPRRPDAVARGKSGYFAK
ncbi:MAG TPA: VWA domain-containing protein [Pyrinomonadaceae bacterium]|nr:VWA domain-containing protein [Pyrinomonadaceae bacterium]